MADMDLRQVRELGDDPADGDTAKVELIGRELEIFVKGFVDPDTGKVHNGTLISRVLTPEEQLKVGRTAGRMAGGPWLNLPPLEQARILAVAQVAVQIREPPEWFDAWAPLVDDLLFQIVGQCRAHNQRYLRAGRAEGGETTGRPLVSVSSALFAASADGAGAADAAQPRARRPRGGRAAAGD